MTRLLSLQGGMAAGKTTAIRWLAIHEPRVYVLEEDIACPSAEVRRRNLDKHRFEDYIEIQRLFIRHEIARWQAAQTARCFWTPPLPYCAPARRPTSPGTAAFLNTP